MKAIDRFLQRRRIAVAMGWIPSGSRVLDVGSSDGELFAAGARAGRITSGLGIDPVPATAWVGEPFTFRRGTFPDAVEVDDGTFDVITMLAVFEHVPASAHPGWSRACHDLLRPGGRVIVTVPAAAVDPILDVLHTLRLIDGMALEEHHGFHAGDTPGAFGSERFALTRRRRFQLGLNNLFVLERRPGSVPGDGQTGSTATSTTARPVSSASTSSDPA